MLEMSGVLEANDYIRAQYLHLRPRLLYKIIGVVVLALVVWGYWLALNDTPYDAWDILFLALPILLVFQFTVYLPWKTRRLYRQQKAMQRHLTYTIDDHGISVESDNGTWKTPWEDVHRFKMNDRLILLYVSDCLYQILPKRFLSEPNDYERLRGLVMEKVSKGAA